MEKQILDLTFLGWILVMCGFILFVTLLVLLGILFFNIILPWPVDTRPPKPKDKWKPINDPEKNGDIPAKGGKLPPIQGVPRPPWLNRRKIK